MKHRTRFVTSLRSLQLLLAGGAWDVADEAHSIDLIRSFLICLLAFVEDRAFAVGFYNDSSDYLAFFVVVLFIFQIANLVVTISARYKKPAANEWLRSLETKEEQESKPVQSLAQSSLIVFLTSIATGLTFILIG